MHKLKKLIIPTAGIGTRLAPITSVIHKSMLPVMCKPLIHYAIEEGVKANVEEFIIIVSNEENKKLIENYIRFAESLLQIKQDQIIFVKQDKQLGLGHAILITKNYINNESFAVLLPDEVFIDIKGNGLLMNMINAQDKISNNVLAVYNISEDNVHKYGIVKTQHDNKKDDYYKISGMIEKPKYEDVLSTTAIIGRYILQTKIFDYLQHITDIYLKNNMNNQSKQEISLTLAMHNMLQDGEEFYAFCAPGHRFDCGNIVGLIEANIVIALQDNKLKIEISKMLRQILSM